MAKAFPSAYGFGTATIGGRGGVVMDITNTNDAGSGSARAALEATVPRIVVPRAGGMVTLRSNINITHPFLTYAGQVAPGGGLAFRNYQVNILDTHDIIVRHLRVYTGQAALGAGRVTNPILIFGSPGTCYNIVLDHCSALWSTDECLTVYNHYRDITVQHCLIAEANDLGKGGGVQHSLGSLISQGSAQAGLVHTSSHHHNVYISCGGRVPVVAGFQTDPGGGYEAPNIRADLRNNIAYNWRGNNYTQTGRGFYTLSTYNDFVAQLGADATLVEVNYVKNVSIKGHFPSADNNSLWVKDNVKIYASQNLGPAHPTVPVDGFAIGVQRDNFLYNGHTPAQSTNAPGTYDPTPYEALTPFAMPAIVESDPTTLVAELAANSGATLPVKDSTHLRIMQELLTQTAGPIVDRTPESAYPSLANGTYPTDTSGDGIPDAWAIAHGLNPAVDYSQVLAASGYTHLENYLNEAAGDTIDPNDYGPPPTVNQAPVHSFPSPQTVIQDATLVFAALFGNGITVADPDAGGANLEVTLTSTNGVMSLGQTTGLTFLLGDGVDDSAMQFLATVAAINAALEGMAFQPTAAYVGPATITITTRDFGYTGNAPLDSDPALSAKYPFASGGVDVIGAQTATLNNGASIVLDGERGNVVGVDGVDDFVEIPVAVTNGLAVFSVSFWVKTTEAGSHVDYWKRPTLVGVELAGAGSNDFGLMTENGFIGVWTGLASGGGDNVFLSATTQINDDAWHQVTYINDGVASQLYVDGVFQGALTTGKALANASCYLGASHSFSGTPVTTSAHQGQFADLRVFTRALSGVEVEALYSLVGSDVVAITVGVASDPVVTVPGPQVLTAGVAGSIAGITVDDPEGGIIIIDLSCVLGTMSLAVVTGLTFTVGDGVGDAAMTFSGTLSTINAALATLTFLPTGSQTSDVITVTATDSIGLFDTETIAIIVTALAWTQHRRWVRQGGMV